MTLIDGMSKHKFSNDLGYKEIFYFHPDKSGKKTASFIETLLRFEKGHQQEDRERLQAQLIKMIADNKVDKNATMFDTTPVFHLAVLKAPVKVVEAMMAHPETEVNAKSKYSNAFTTLARYAGFRKTRDFCHNVHDVSGIQDTIDIFDMLIRDKRISVTDIYVEDFPVLPNKANDALAMLSKSNSPFLGIVNDMLIKRSQTEKNNENTFPKLSSGGKASLLKRTFNKPTL